MPGGRPSIYNEQLAALICSQIAEGKSLRTICAPIEMPSIAVIFLWLHQRPEFLEQYTRAKEQQADAFVEDMLSISDDADQDYVTRFREDGSQYQAIDHDHINRARLRVDTRKWIASKLKAKVYGDRIQQNIGGPNGEELKITVTGVKPTEENT